MEVYVVKMERWGSDETHNYIIGVYSNIEEALRQAELEKEYRGGKYDPNVVKLNIDETKSGRYGITSRVKNEY